MKISRISINNGLFLGVILVTFTLVLSYTNPVMFLKSKTFLLSIPFILIVNKAAGEFRALKEGIADFTELFFITFYCGAIAVAICTTFEYFHFNFINPELLDLERKINLEAMEASKAIIGESIIEENKKVIQENNIHSLAQTITFFIIRLVTPCAMYAAIVSLILRNKPQNTIENKQE